MRGDDHGLGPGHIFSPEKEDPKIFFARDKTGFPEKDCKTCQHVAHKKGGPSF
jgi:hypothetical protein